VITGTLKGPTCRRAITLPVTAKFLSLPSDPSRSDSVIARAVLTEPSYWTPELPSLYQVSARLAVNGLEVATCGRPVGLRRFGVRGRSLWLDGRRFVPRGLLMEECDVDVRHFQAASLTAIVVDPSEAFLEHCDAEGVPVIAILAEASGTPMPVAVAAERIAQWAWHAAVLMAVMPLAVCDGDRDHIAEATRGSRGTLLLAHEVDGSKPPPEPAPAVDGFMVALAANTVPHAAWRAAPPDCSLLVRRPRGVWNVVSRSPCDALQAAMAAWRCENESRSAAWDWAGYCVDVSSEGT
jgi:hypothetical protein